MTQWLSDKIYRPLTLSDCINIYSNHVKSLSRGVYPRVSIATAKRLCETAGTQKPRIGYEVCIGKERGQDRVRKSKVYVVNVSGHFGITVYNPV